LRDCQRDGGESTAQLVSFGLDAGLVESRAPESELQHGTFALVRIRTATSSIVNDLQSILLHCRNLLRTIRLHEVNWIKLDRNSHSTN
jgi:hypothetical protein